MHIFLFVYFIARWYLQAQSRLCPIFPSADADRTFFTVSEARGQPTPASGGGGGGGAADR